MNPDSLKPVPEWIVLVLCWIGGIAILLGLLSTMGLWPTFHILGD